MGRAAQHGYKARRVRVVQRRVDDHHYTEPCSDEQGRGHEQGRAASLQIALALNGAIAARSNGLAEDVLVLCSLCWLLLRVPKLPGYEQQFISGDLPVFCNGFSCFGFRCLVWMQIVFLQHCEDRAF